MAAAGKEVTWSRSSGVCVCIFVCVFLCLGLRSRLCSPGPGPLALLSQLHRSINLPSTKTTRYLLRIQSEHNQNLSFCVCFSSISHVPFHFAGASASPPYCFLIFAPRKSLPFQETYALAAIWPPVVSMRQTNLPTSQQSSTYS